MKTERTKTKTKALRGKDYLLGSCGDINMTKLIDAAVERVVDIEFSGVGRQKGRSRGVIIRSFHAILTARGYTTTQAYSLWRNQVTPMVELELNAE